VRPYRTRGISDGGVPGFRPLVTLAGCTLHPSTQSARAGDPGTLSYYRNAPTGRSYPPYPEKQMRGEGGAPEMVVGRE
jgi:hypothetical protein